MARENDSFEIIEFTQDYQEQVIALIGRVLRDQKVIPESPQPLQDDDLYHIPELFSGRGQFWMAVREGQVIGTVAIQEMSGDTAKLKCMFVETESHGTGVGQTLLSHAVDFAIQLGFKEITLTTHQLEKRAHRFYERNGFVKIGEDTDTYRYHLQL